MEHTGVLPFFLANSLVFEREGQVVKAQRGEEDDLEFETEVTQVEGEEGRNFVKEDARSTAAAEEGEEEGEEDNDVKEEEEEEEEERDNDNDLFLAISFFLPRSGGGR